MTLDHRPNILYVGPAVPGMLIEQIHLGLWHLGNVMTCWVPSGTVEKLRGRFTRDFQRVKPDSLTRKLLYKASLLLQKSAGDFTLPGPDAVPFTPDLIFVADVFKKLKGIERYGCPTVFYAQDPHISIKRYSDLARVQEYKYVFVTQKNTIERFREIGCKNVTWLPWACDHDVFVGPQVTRDIDVSFFGTVNPESSRVPFVTMLEQQFGLSRKRLYLRDMAAELRRSKIVFNKSLTGDLNQRNFEAMGAGALLVTDRIDNGLYDLFHEKVHLVSYGDTNELERVVTYYLKHDDEREEIALEGQREVVSRHTYLHRASEVFQTCLGVDLNAEVEQRIAAVKAVNPWLAV